MGESLGPLGLFPNPGEPHFLKGVFEANHSYGSLISHHSHLPHVVPDHELYGGDNFFPNLHGGLEGHPVFIGQQDFVNLSSRHDPTKTC